MSESTDDTALYSVISGGRMNFADRAAAARLVRQVRDSPNFCYRCLVPVVRSYHLDDLQLSTVATFAHYTTLVEDYPPGKIDDNSTERPSHRKVEVCDCGWIDKPPNETRKRGEVEAALEHLVSLLQENGVNVDRRIARRVVREGLDEGLTGKFCETLGTAIYQAISIMDRELGNRDL